MISRRYGIGRAPRAGPWAVALVCLLPLCLREFSDPDIWFHLTIGREIFERGGLPAEEFYIFPALGESAHYSAPGYGLLQYLLHLAGGLPALVLFNALVLSGTLCALCAAYGTRDRAFSPALLALAAAVAFVGLNPRFVHRPETLLYLALALEIWLLERWLADGRWGRLLALPALSLLLANLHSTWIFVPLVYGAYLVHWWLAQRRLPDTGPPTWCPPALAGVLLLSMLAALANPYGVDQWLLLIAGLGGGNALVEYLPVYQTEYLPHFLVLLAAIAAAAIVARGLRVCDLLLAVGLGALALLSARNIAMLGMAALMPVAAGLHALWASRPGLRRRGGQGAVAALAIGLTLAATAAERNWGWSIKPESVPIQGGALLKSRFAGGKVFNFFHFGGYLAWDLGRNFQVAMDGHFVRASAAQDLHNRFFRADPGWRAIAARYGIVAIVTPATLSYSGSLIPLVAELATDPGWRLVAVEPAGLSFVPESLAGPLPALDKRELWQQVIREARRTLHDYPGQPGALAAIARAQSALSAAILR